MSFDNVYQYSGIDNAFAAGNKTKSTISWWCLSLIRQKWGINVRINIRVIFFASGRVGQSLGNGNIIFVVGCHVVLKIITPILLKDYYFCQFL